MPFWDRFAVLALTYKALHGLGPRYLSEHLSLTSSTHATRSMKAMLLEVAIPRGHQDIHKKLDLLGCGIIPLERVSSGAMPCPLSLSLRGYKIRLFEKPLGSSSITSLFKFLPPPCHCLGLLHFHIVILLPCFYHFVFI